MAWKPKEKELTREEAIALAKKELSRYWFGSTPLFAAIEKEGQRSLRPLDKKFEDGRWMVFVADPTHFSFDVCIPYIHEFHHRFHLNDLSFLVVLRSEFEFMRTERFISSLQRRYHWSFPVAVDAEGLITQTFGIKSWPFVMVSDRSQMVLEAQGLKELAALEPGLHGFLRQADPGLPLQSPFQLQEKLADDLRSFNLGIGSTCRIQKGVFQVLKEDLEEGVFPSLTVPQRQELLKEHDLVLEGKWLRDKDKLWTEDKSARLAIELRGTQLRILGQSTSKKNDSTKVLLESQELGIPEYQVGPDMGVDDEGKSGVRLDQPKLLHLINREDTQPMTILFRFPQAERAGAALYGFREGAPLARAND